MTSLQGNEQMRYISRMSPPWFHVVPSQSHFTSTGKCVGDAVPSSYRELSGAQFTGLIIDGVVDILWHVEEWAVSISLVCLYLFISGLLSLLVSFSSSHLSFSRPPPSLDLFRLPPLQTLVG